MTTSPKVMLRDGNQIPQLGYGVWQVDDAVAEEVVGKAFEVGYRHIDTAQAYGNEGGVGRAFAKSRLKRDEVFITTKVWNADQGYDSTLKAFHGSMDRLGLDTLDMYLIHWLQPVQEKYLDTWRALIHLQYEGFVKSIGVSNFTIGAINHIVGETGEVPVVNQVETHPYFTQRELRRFEAKKSIVHEAWSPLGQGGDVLQDQTIAGIADLHGATPAQVIIAWHLALGNVAIPKSVTESRIIENFNALDVKLEPAEVAAISALDRGQRIGPDPAVADFQ